MIDPSKISATSRRKLLEERRRNKESTAAEKARFEGCLQQVRSKDTIKELEELIKTIQREGERLSHFRSMAQLDHYKHKIQEFLEKTNRATFKVKATGFTDQAGDYATHLKVEKVDSALEDLTKYVFDKSAHPLQILQQLDLIKGLLTDLYQ